VRKLAHRISTVVFRGKRGMARAVSANARKCKASDRIFSPTFLNLPQLCLVAILIFRKGERRNSVSQGSQQTHRSNLCVNIESPDNSWRTR
jgi:hypothetical protein